MNIRRSVHLLTGGFFVAVALAGAPAAHAQDQDPVQAAKAHYEAAAYEEALTVLASAADLSGRARVEVQQYRAMSLLALGRTEEATKAVEALVEADPEYVPPASVASPKVQALVADVRGEQLPAVIRSLVSSGRAAFEAQAFDRARADFSLALKLLADPVLQEWTEREDVRVLVDGFVALASAREAEAARAPAASAPPASATVATTGRIPSPAPAETPAPAADLVVEPPVAIMQAMPPWLPPDALAQTRDYEGVLKIEIGVDGRVKSAKIEEPSHPAYDARLLHAARQWVFKPAMRGGQPVESEKLIAVQLHPREDRRREE